MNFVFISSVSKDELLSIYQRKKTKMLKKLIFLSLALVVILGCQLTGGESTPAEEPAQEEATQENTATPAPTATLEPTAEPTNTPIPEPTAIPEPQPGDLMYKTTFDDIGDWEMKARDDLAGYKSESRSDGLYLQVPDDNDFWIAYYNGLNANVRMEADVEKTNGTNFTYIDLYCRASEDGMYVFQLDTGGYWYIAKYDFNADQVFTQLASGASNKIKSGNNLNHMTAICDKDELTFKINDELISSVQDSQFTGGGIGIGAETADIPFAEFMFHELEVFVP